MTIKHVQEVITEIEIKVFDANMAFRREGISVSLEIENSSADNYDWHLITWDDVLSSALASSCDDGDCQSISKNLREVADKLDAWDRGYYPEEYPADKNCCLACLGTGKATP